MATKNRIGVEVRNNNIDKALHIFKKKVQATGILYQYRQNQEFTKPSTEKREKRKTAKWNQLSYDKKHIWTDLKIKGHKKS